MARVHVFFSGTVQGVGFRYSVKNTAAKFAVTGWVRNRTDGRVELVAEGSKPELEAFVQRIEEEMDGYIASRTVLWEPEAGEFPSFTIEPTQ